MNFSAIYTLRALGSDSFRWISLVHDYMTNLMDSRSNGANIENDYIFFRKKLPEFCAIFAYHITRKTTAKILCYRIESFRVQRIIFHHFSSLIIKLCDLMKSFYSDNSRARKCYRRKKSINRINSHFEDIQGLSRFSSVNFNSEASQISFND